MFMFFCFKSDLLNWGHIKAPSQGGLKMENLSWQTPNSFNLVTTSDKRPHTKPAKLLIG